MSNETNPQGPLKATLGEQLGEKAQHGDAHAKEALESETLRTAAGADAPAASPEPDATRSRHGEGKRSGRSRRGRHPRPSPRAGSAPAARGAAGAGLPAWTKWAAAAAGWMILSSTLRRVFRR